jgi:DNA-directed RNA polymerase specialized sigma subunit
MMDYVAEKAKQLNIEEKIILYLKFQFGLTNKKIGDLLNFTGERIRQKLDLTIGKLRDGLNV